MGLARLVLSIKAEILLMLEFLKEQIYKSNIEQTQEIAQDTNDNKHGGFLLQGLIMSSLERKP